MSSPVEDCLRGRISAPVAVSRMLLGGADAGAIRKAVTGAAEPGNPAWQELAGLVDGRDAALDGLAAEIRALGSDHTSLGGLAGIARFFDRAVAHSPEAGVALYSLGDPALLAAATAEVVEWLAREALVPAEADVLDLGCGAGRIAAALAARCRSVLGVDVSPGMVAEAQRRHAETTNLRFAVTDGHTSPPGAFDLILAVDSMPYMLQAGVADTMISGAAATLRPQGALVVLNLSYGRTVAEDRADALRWAGDAGLVLSVAGAQPFKLWDGDAWVWRHPATVERAGAC